VFERRLLHARQLNRLGFPDQIVGGLFYSNHRRVSEGYSCSVTTVCESPSRLRFAATRWPRIDFFDLCVKSEFYVNEYVIITSSKESLDILIAQAYDSDAYSTFLGVGGAYAVPLKPMAVGRRCTLIRNTSCVFGKARQGAFRQVALGRDGLHGMLTQLRWSDRCP
jgi:hypothetical protein